MLLSPWYISLVALLKLSPNEKIFGTFGITLDIVDERRISSSPPIVAYRECFAVSKTLPPFSVRSIVPE
ncbi:hypothetical protein NQ318_007187 [Aromia moschata]|uniref:Uncharacterized protein n=1 Tax=Aromia moschata TaxID=1265417 RepID=A0AAV8XYJ4_9CUCU|nr:hypothetical protein NQ318_007187 [Aromia moschata]